MSQKKKGKANPRTRSIILLCIYLVFIVVVGTFAITGGRFGSDGLYILKPWGSAISLGLDLRGGVYTVYRGIDPGDGTFDSLMNGTVSVLTNRLSAQGYTEATIVRQGTDRIRIEIPDVQDPNQILDIIGTPAVLTFLDPNGEVIMEGKHVKTAVAAYIENKPVVSFELTDEGRTLFADATRANLGKVITIQLDGQTISAPTVNSAITGGSGYIEGMGDAAAAQQLAILIQSGALPLEIEQLEVSAISATLGVEALDRAVLAGIIGVILVMLFMIWRYRLCGIVADLALTLYIMIVFFILAVSNIQLTLAGVLGIVLGIGMAVDANVVIFERIREEVKKGRPFASSIKTGYQNALSAVVDANITTIIAALVLMIFGTGTIKGFANTLAISVVVSMFTAIIVTRFLLKAFANIGGTNKPALYVR